MKSTCLFSFLLTLFTVQSVIACTCIDYGVPTCKRFSDSDAVFIGKIERITSAAAEKYARVTSKGLNSISWASLGMIAVHFKVEKSFKGVQDKIVKVLTYKGTSCDLEIKKGQRWVVYASKNEETGFLSFGACGGNYRMSEDSDVIQELEGLSQGKVEMSVVGRVTRYKYNEIKDAKVFLEGNGLSLSTQTDNAGFYKFSVSLAGKYKIKVIVPFSANLLRYDESRDIKSSPTETETAFEYEAEVSQSNCDYEYFDTFTFDLKANAVINGKFISPTMQEFPAMYPKLCRLKRTEEETLSSCFTNYWVKSDGTFSFSGNREGKYIIVISENNFPEFHSPFLKHFYPGVRDFSEAQIINLEQGAKTDDFRL